MTYNGDSRDGGGRPSIYLASTGFSNRGCGHLLGPLVSAWQVVPPGFPWIQQGGGQTTQLDHEGDRGSRTGSAKLGFGRSASRRGLSDTQRLCQTTQLSGCSSCAAFQPLLENNIAPEFGESKKARDVLMT